LNRQKPYRFLHWLGLLCSMVSIVLGIGILVCYITRWDHVAAVTFLPFWVWGIMGTMLTLIAWRLHRRIWHLLISLIWVCLTLFYSDDISRLIRPHLSGKAPVTGRHLRVISLNCAGQVSAAAEAGSWKPDIVLLQESPSSNDVAKLSREWFGDGGDFLVGLDCSIIARGRLTRLSDLKTTRFSRTHLALPQGTGVEVISLRLVPPVVRLDLWSPACWRAHLYDRRVRKEQMQQLVDDLQGFKADIPYIAGGDFNSPAGDAVSALLKPRLKDTFRDGGIGWGNTGINEFPVSRPDQIWVSRDFQTIAAWAVKTRNSDHRMVVCDLALHP
jgi:vancomycin resistance protein VanJ